MAADASAPPTDGSGKPKGDPLPAQLGRYAIEKKLGQGGMGTVYLARDSQLKRLVALKVLPKDKAENPTLVKRFQAEAQAAAQLRHENIVTVYESGAADGQLFIAMEYVEGVDLHDLINQRGRIPLRRSIEMMKQMASALDHAHTQNIVHRDIKPSNMLIRRDGLLKVTDLGLARSVDDTLETNITRAGTTVGTVDYMAPEQARNSKAADIRSDLYSLGCTWYHMLTGRPPYPDGSLTNKLQAHAASTIPNPRDKNPAVTEAVVGILQRLMAKKPADRYQTPKELLQDLERGNLTKAGVANAIFRAVAEEDGEEYSDEEEDEEEDDQPSGKTTGRRVEPGGKSTNRSSGSKSHRPGHSARFDDEENDNDEPEDDGDADNDQVAGEPRSAGRHRRKSDSGSGRRSSRSPAAQDDDDEDYDSIDNQEDENEASSRGPVRDPVLKKKLRPVLDSDEGETDEEGQPRRNTRNSQGEDAGPVGERSRKKSKPKGSDADETDDSRTESSSKRRRTADKEFQPRSVLPPKQQAKTTDSDTQPTAGINLAVLKKAAIVVGIIAAATGLGAIVLNYANGFSVSAVAPHENPFGTGGDRLQDPHAGAQALADAKKKAAQAPSEEVAKTSDQPKQVTKARTRPLLDSNNAPAWANTPLDTKSLPVLTVGPGLDSETHSNSLAMALGRVTSKGAVVRIAPGAVLVLTPTQLPQTHHLVIESSGDSEPVILLKPAPGDPPNTADTSAGLRMIGGRLTLNGLHLRYDNPASSPESDQAPVRLIDLENTNLTVNRCLFEIRGNSPRPVTAIAHRVGGLTGQNQGRPQIAVNQSVIAGENVIGLSLAGTMGECVIRQSLLATGNGSSVQLAVPPWKEASTEALYPERVLRFIHSTICSEQTAVELQTSTAPEETPPALAIVSRDSLFTARSPVADAGAEPPANRSVLLSATTWPQNADRALGESRLKGLLWNTEKSAFMGFRFLADLGEKSAYRPETASQWFLLWGANPSPAELENVVSTPWPTFVSASRLSHLISSFDSARLANQAVSASDGTAIGCDVTALPTPDESASVWIDGLARRPELPQAVERGDIPEAKGEINLALLKSGDLSTELDSKAADGDTWIIKGLGIRPTLPVVLKNKSLTLVFVQTDKSPNAKSFVIQPKSEGANNIGSIFRVEGGRLELRGAQLAAIPPGKGGTAKPLVDCVDGDLILRKCEVRGPAAESSGAAVVIRWKSSPTATRNPILALNDSALLSANELIQVDAPVGNIHVRNSLLASREELFAIARTQGDPDPSSAGLSVSITQSTAVSGMAGIKIASGSGSPGSPLPAVRLFAEQSVFYAGAGGAPKPELHFVLQRSGLQPAPDSLAWWGRYNAFSNNFVVLTESDGPLPTSPDATLRAWVDTWGAGHESESVIGPNGAELQQPTTGKWWLGKSPDFAVKLASAAGRKLPNRPLGIEPGELNPLLVAEPARQDAPGATKPGPKPFKPNSPGF